MDSARPASSGNICVPASCSATDRRLDFPHAVAPRFRCPVARPVVRAGVCFCLTARFLDTLGVRSHSFRRGLIRWAVPPAALAAIASLAAGEVDAAAGAESAYLGRLAAGVLLAVAALAPAPAPAPAVELTWGAALVVTAVWALPAGPGRGAAAMAVLGAALGIAAVRRLSAMASPRAARGGAAPSRRTDGRAADEGQVLKDGRAQETAGGESAAAGPAATAVVAIAVCFGGQVLLRGELLFGLGRTMRPWVALIALPFVAGIALTMLWRRRGLVPAIAAAGAAMILAPGWTVTTVLAMTALAGGSCLDLRWRHRPGRKPQTDRDTGGAIPQGFAGNADTASNAGVASIHGIRRLVSTGQRGWRALACLAAMAAPVAWEPRAGWAAALAGLTMWRPWAGLGLAIPAAIVVRTLPLPGALAGHASLQEAAASVSWLLLAVPAALLAIGWPGRRVVLGAAVLLALATPWLPDRSQLAGPLALAALALPESGVAAGVGALWSAALVAGAGLLASYPWLRHDPAGDALALLGAAPGPRLAAAVALATLAVGSVTLLPFFRGRRGTASGAWAAAGIAGAALLLAVAGRQAARPATPLLTAGATVVLDSAHPRWVADIVGARPVRAVLLESSLDNAAGLANGTPVAEVRLVTTGGSAGLAVVAGRDTGEWAARRADVAARARLAGPAGWMSWVAGTYFGQSYRTRLPLARPGSFVQVQVALAPGLPPGLGLALRQVELER